MGDLKVGDVVFDENGEPCNVTLATEIQYNRECYRVRFSDGAEIFCDRDHLWTFNVEFDKLEPNIYTMNTRKAQGILRQGGSLVLPVVKRLNKKTEAKLLGGPGILLETHCFQTFSYSANNNSGTLKPSSQKWLDAFTPKCVQISTCTNGSGKRKSRTSI